MANSAPTAELRILSSNLSTSLEVPKTNSVSIIILLGSSSVQAGVLAEGLPSEAKKRAWKPVKEKPLNVRIKINRYRNSFL